MRFNVGRKCIGALWLIVDPRWGAGARWAFPPASGQGKTATRLQGERRCSMALWRGLLGVNAKKSHVLRLDEGASSHRPKIRVAISINRVPYRP